MANGNAYAYTKVRKRTLYALGPSMTYIAVRCRDHIGLLSSPPSTPCGPERAKCMHVPTGTLLACDATFARLYIPAVLPSLAT